MNCEWSPGHVFGEWCTGPDAKHLLVVTFGYRFRWRWPFVTRTHALRCFECPLTVREP